MTSLVLDTHSLLWYLESSARLSATARLAIQDAIRNNYPVFISAITIVEVIYLVEKGRFTLGLLDQLLHLLRDPISGILVAPFDLRTTEALRSIPGNLIRDMPDRMIAATAIALGLPIVSRDRQIQSSGITVIW